MSFVYDARFRQWALQVFVLGALLSGFAWMWKNIRLNLEQLGLELGFGIFSDTAGFPISEVFPVPLFGWAEALFLVAALAAATWSLRTRLKLKHQGRLRTCSLRENLIVSTAWFAAPVVLWLLWGVFASEWSTVDWHDFDPEKSYGMALAVGFANTLKVALLGIVLATFLGLAIGLARTSGVKPLEYFGASYVEFLRNIPVLLQLVFWYAVVLNVFPLVQDGLNISDAIFLNNRGLFLPEPLFEGSVDRLLFQGFFAAAAWGVVSVVWNHKMHHRGLQSAPASTWARHLPWLVPLLGFLLTLSVCVLLSGVSLSFQFPEKVFGGRNLRGGLTLSPEFLALLMGLSLYTATFVAEIVRSGLSAVDRGQTEAARALGLSGFQTLRRVVLPQAVRVMVPPLTSQYLNLAKNSSLAVAVGYPDLVAVGGTILNQTGKSIEVILVWMAVYLSLSLVISLVMNVYNTQVKLVGR